MEEEKVQANILSIMEQTPPQRRAAIEGLKLMFLGLALELANLPVGRERSISITKLEEAAMWAQAAVSRS